MLAGGGWKGGDSKQREVGREKNRKDQRVPAEERMRKHATPSLGSSNFFFVAGAATRLIQRVDARLCRGERGTREEERRGKKRKENTANTAEDEPSGRISAASTIIRDL